MKIYTESSMKYIKKRTDQRKQQIQRTHTHIHTFCDSNFNLTEAESQRSNRLDTIVQTYIFCPCSDANVDICSYFASGKMYIGFHPRCISPQMFHIYYTFPSPRWEYLRKLWVDWNQKRDDKKAVFKLSHNFGQSHNTSPIHTRICINGAENTRFVISHTHF